MRSTPGFAAAGNGAARIESQSENACPRGGLRVGDDGKGGPGKSERVSLPLHAMAKMFATEAKARKLKNLGWFPFLGTTNTLSE